MSYTTYLRWGALSALFLTLFVPFIVATGTFWPNLFFPYITGKNLAFRILVELALLCYILLACAEPKYRPSRSLVGWCVLLFVGWMAIATATSLDPIKSFWSNFERMEGYVGLLHLFAWFVVTGALLSAENLWERFFNTSIGLAAAQGVWAILQVAGVLSISTQSGVRADTTFGNATYLAVYLLLNFFLTLYLLLRKRHSATMQVLYGLALVLQFVGLYYTETRGALLGLFGGLLIAAVYMALFAREREFKTARRLSVGGLVALLVLAGAFFAVKETSLVKKSNTLARLASISLTDRTTQSRFLIWGEALRGAQEKPIFGWGQENFSYVFNKYYDPRMYNQEAWFDRAHNQFLDWLIAGGIPAFIFYIALYALAAWAIWRSSLSRPEKAVLLGLVGGYAFNNLFVFDNLTSAMYFFALLAFAHSLSKKQAPSLWFSKPMGEHALAIAAPVVAGVIVVGGWALNAPALARASVLIDALQTQKAGLNAQGAVVGVPKNPQENLASYTTALQGAAWPGNPIGYQETVEQLMQFASNLAPSTSLDPQAKEVIATTAYNAIINLMLQRPHDARLELFAATFLGSYGQNGEARKYLDAALQDSPKKQQLLIQLGNLQAGTGDMQGALASFKQAFEEERGYTLARNFYAAALYAAGQNAQADALLQEAYGTTVVDEDQLLQAYAGFKLYNQIIAVWQLRVQKNPNDPQVHLGLASAYFAALRKAETIAELKQIEKLSPATAGQMEALIKQIEDGTLKPQ